jgi:diguanylate cyclase (GGDEF)-like protein
LDSAQAGAWTLDLGTNIFQGDATVAHLVGLHIAPSGVDFDRVLDGIDPDTRADFLYALSRATNMSGRNRQVFSVHGGKRWLATTFLRDPESERVVFHGLLRDYGTQRESEQETLQHQQQLEALVKELRKSSRVDALTGLINRTGFNEQLQVMISSATKHNTWLSMLIVDVDFFKSYNDGFGHGEGDLALKQVANEIASCLRGTDVAVRFGGEEFCILSQSDPDLAMRIAERVRAAVAQSSWAKRAVTVSVGIHSLRGAAIDGSQLLKLADEALYRAKDAGRNCVKQAPIVAG